MIGYSVRTQGLCVHFGSTQAMDGLDLVPGRIHGLLGGNGAGNTYPLTPLWTLAALCPPGTGSVAPLLLTFVLELDAATQWTPWDLTFETSGVARPLVLLILGAVAFHALTPRVPIAVKEG